MSSSYFINFRRAGTVGQRTDFSAQGCKDTERQGQLRKRLSGAEARAFYEETLSSAPNIGRAPVELAKHGNALASRRQTSRKRPRQEHSSASPCGVSGLFRAAQDGDVNVVRKAVDDEGCNLNSKDSFSWTPLMCSCHAGHDEIVRFLLERGAQWQGVMDKKGRDARQLAIMSGHWQIVKCLDSQEVHDASAHKIVEESSEEELHCSDCQLTFRGTRSQHRHHLSSTAHLFAVNHGRGEAPSFYGLPTSNRGYQMLVKDGWNMEGGLGPKGEGRKYPIKTVLKRDRGGVGSRNGKERVTHFLPYDTHAVSSRNCDNAKPPQVNLTKRQLRRRQERGREKEKHLRRELGDTWA